MANLQLATAAQLELSPFFPTFVQTNFQNATQPNHKRNHRLVVSQLSEADQAALLKALKSKMLLLQARRLDQSVKPNQVEMEKIVEEVRKARQFRSDAAASRRP